MDSMIMALRSTYRPEAAGGEAVSYQLRVGEVAVHARVGGGRLAVAAGEVPDADLVIETGPVIRALLAGEVSPDQAIADGSARITGEPGLLARFAATFRVDPAPARPA